MKLLDKLIELLAKLFNRLINSIVFLRDIALEILGKPEFKAMI